MRTCLALACAVQVVGCTINVTDNGNGDEAPRGSRGDLASQSGASARRSPSDISDVDVGFEAVADCHSDRRSFEAAAHVYSEARHSVHELITCGGMQVDLAFKLRLLLIASNSEHFDEDTYEDLQELAETLGVSLDIAFEQELDGSWQMDIPSSGSSAFALRFHEGDDDDTLLENPFEISSYLVGVHAESELTFEEMAEDPQLQNTFTYYFEELGPLGHLLNDGHPLESPFEIRLSLVELLFGGSSLWSDSPSSTDYGPFNSVLELEMSSQVVMDDPRVDVTVSYDVLTERDTVRDIAASSRLDFDVQALQATDGEYRVQGDASELRYVQGGLAGRIEYAVEGPDVELHVTSDFGEGAAYPEPRWRCPD